MLTIEEQHEQATHISKTNTAASSPILSTIR